jgi:hypothetical protein
MVSVSFKYASGGDLVGTFYSDRRRAVGGVLGPGPEILPLDVSISQDGRAPFDYAFEVTRTRPFSSLFAGLATAGAVSEAAHGLGRSSVSLRATLETSAGPVSYETLFYTMEPALRTGGELSALMDVVMDGAFEDVDVRSARAEISIERGELLDTVERVVTDSGVCGPGERIALTVTLRDRSGAERDVPLRLTVPHDTPDGPAYVRVGGASEFHEWDAERLGQGLRPRTWEQLRHLIESSRPGDTVVAQLLSDRPGLSLSGRELDRVPGKAALVMGTAPESGAVVPTGLTVLSEDSLRTGREVRGFHELQIFVASDD